MNISDGIKNAVRWATGAPSKQELAKSDAIKDTKDVFEKAEEGISAYYDTRDADNTAKLMKPQVKYVRDHTADPRVKLLADTAMDVKTRYDDVASKARLMALQTALDGVQEPATKLLANVALRVMTPSYSRAQSIRNEPIYLDPNHKFKSGLRAFGIALGDAFVLTDLDNRSQNVGKTFLKAIRSNSDNPDAVAIADNALKSKGDSESITEIYWSALTNIARAEKKTAVSSSAAAVGGMAGMQLGAMK